MSILRIFTVNVSSYRYLLNTKNLRLLTLLTNELSSTSAKSNRKIWRSRDVRKSFVDYFNKDNGHLIVPSSSVIPTKGQGTYFTNAGMNQFKPIFLGMTDPDSRLSSYRRVVNSQKCIRVGGKHNDLDDVGADLTHHTFFEMLGSWSFGDYFKKETCSMALDLLTGVFHLPKDQLYVTYFGGNEALGLGPDLEVKDIWLSLGMAASHVLPFGTKDNFWDMGESGPCGPCTEIHFDHVGHGRDAAGLVNRDCADVVEVWNLVFIEFNRLPDESLVRLSKSHVDTGMGLERMTAILHGSRSNYDTDLFQPLFTRIEKVTGAPPYRGRTGADDSDLIDRGYRILADHARMICVAIADGLLPGGDNLEHKLRQIIHRSMKQAEDIFRTKRGLLLSLVDDVVQSLGDTYPELEKNSEKIKEVLRQSEENYFQMKAKGIQAFERMLRKEGVPSFKLAGKTVWQLHQGRFGDPVFLDQIMDLAEERGLHIDMDGFYRKQQEFKEQSQTASAKMAGSKIELYFPALDVLWERGVPNTACSDRYNYTKTDGHYAFPSPRGQVVALLTEDRLTKSVSSGDVCGIVLDRTCFYHESGGQAADHGTITTESGCFEVSDVQDFYGYIIHIGTVTDGSIQMEDFVKPRIDEEFRLACMKSHTATHMLNVSLSSVVGDIAQKGSDISGEKFSFDFSSLSSLSVDSVQTVEEKVNTEIKAGLDVHTRVLSLDEALKIKGLVYLGNEDYPQHVRVVMIQDSDTQVSSEREFFSAELCGGTHVRNSADIEHFCITRQKGVAAGTKRLSCVTGKQAVQAQENGRTLKEMFERLEEEVKNHLNPIGWLETVKNINKLLQEDLLPKVIREEIAGKLEMLGETVKHEYNKEIQKLIQQEILQLQTECPKYIVKQIGCQTDNKQLMKAIAELKITQPTAVLAEGERAYLVLLCAQKNNASASEVLQSAKDVLCQSINSKVSVAKVGKDNIGHMLVVKGNLQPSEIASVIQDSFVKSVSR
ncbi:alanine--tRNA ligase, cytoplasmic-like isoform X2 [Gigantopelta aegis]|uniref:alanine--tRNA ligase, cytoplasmic-like isoform X2 n=1 Tax=Gigantopelta aegis TaxID=1735272 RepID=UPI001B88DD3F|nr:alanine--tRNA ligase, cytoplasmic-like isoform X2 [Gigantopelta aegis]